MRQSVQLLSDLRYATPQRRRLLLEALFSLAAIRPTLRCIPFQTLAARMGRPVRGPEPPGAAREQLCRDTRWAILRAARSLPGKTVCFPRALVAQSLLRRRGIGTELYYGAAILPAKGLTTHVWLQNGHQEIVGCRAAGQYHVLACYSSRLVSQHDGHNRHPERAADLGRDAGL